MHICWLIGYNKWIQVINACFLRGRRGGVARKISKIPDPPFYPHQRQESKGWVTFPCSVTQSKTRRAVTSCKLRERTFNSVKCFWHLMIFSYDRMKVPDSWSSEPTSVFRAEVIGFTVTDCTLYKSKTIKHNEFCVLGGDYWPSPNPPPTVHKQAETESSWQRAERTLEGAESNVLFDPSRFRSVVVNMTLPLETETNSALIRSVPREGRDRVRTLHSQSRDKPCAGSVIPRYANRHGEVELRWLQLHQDV